MRRVQGVALLAVCGLLCSSCASRLRAVDSGLPDATSAAAAASTAGDDSGDEPYRPTHMQLLQHMANAAALSTWPRGLD